MSINTAADSSTPVVESGDFIRATIVGKSYVQIDRLNSDISWLEPVHAINWFNTRFMALYNFYNLVAARSVTIVGGKPLFKGTLIKQIEGDANDLRTVLLIVRYPSPLHFKNMVENHYFKMVSLLRVMAVQKFTFCLTRTAQQVTVPPNIDRTVSYAAHHFRGGAGIIGKVDAIPDKKGIRVEFSSFKTHRLSSAGSNGVAAPIPALMDGLILFSAADNSALELFFDSTDYQNIIDQTETSFVGLFQRLM